MSDLRFFDAACCWVEGQEPNATFHHTVACGCASLSLWRFIKCKLGETFLTDCPCCRDWLQKTNDDSVIELCSWCRKDQHVCLCEVDADGLVWTEYGVGIPKEDFDLPF